LCAAACAAAAALCAAACALFDWIALAAPCMLSVAACAALAAATELAARARFMARDGLLPFVRFADCWVVRNI
jgi:hypothetical protein